MTKPGHEQPLQDNTTEGRLFSGDGSLIPPPLEEHSDSKPESSAIDGTIIKVEPSDEFDRRDGQGIWTGEYSREGKYPSGTPVEKQIYREHRGEIKTDKRSLGAGQKMRADEAPQPIEKQSRAHQLDGIIAEEDRKPALEGLNEAKRMLGLDK